MKRRQPRGALQLGVEALPAPEEATPVKVTLHDCLACSGCVTSAEAILLQSQVGSHPCMSQLPL